MLRRFAGLAIIAGLSLPAGALAQQIPDTTSFPGSGAVPDDAPPLPPATQEEEQPEERPVLPPTEDPPGGLSMSMRGAPLSDDKPPIDPAASREDQKEAALDHDDPQSTAAFKVSDNLLDKTVVLPEYVKGQGDLDYYYRLEEGDLKTGGGFKTPEGAYGDTSVSMTWRVENGTVAFAAPGDVTLQTPIGMADSMEMATDAVNMGLSYAPPGVGGF